MYCLEDLKFNKLYKKQFMLPFIKEDKRHGSAILLLTPNYESSNALMNSPFTVDRMRLFSSYYIEKDIMYTINTESRHLEIDYPEYGDNGVILEGGNTFTETLDIKEYGDLRECEITDLYCRLGNKMIFFNEMYDEDILTEVAGVNTKYRKMLYNDRIRNNQGVIALYDQVKKDNKWITRAFPNYQRYKKFNLFIDLYYYNQSYLNNNTFTLIKSVDMYFEFIRRFINDKRIDNAGYTKKTVFIPVDGWNPAENSNLYDYKKNLNPISVLYKKIRFARGDLECFKGITFVFFGKNGYFKMDTDNIDNQTYTKFMRFIKALESHETIIDDEEEEDSTSNAIAADIVNDIEKSSGAKIDNVSPNVDASTAKTAKEADKATLVKKIAAVSAVSKTKDDALEKLEADKDIKRIIADLQSEPDNGINISAARSSRITNANDEFMQKQLSGKSIKEMINAANKPKELSETSIPIETINDEWHHMKAVNFEKEYDLDADIIKCLNSLSDKENKRFPISILDVSKEDTSNSEDSIYTYTVKCEGYNGARFTFKFDIPKFRNNRFMRLRGNEKIFSIEMPLIPISKTSDTDAQIVTYYNKLFVFRYNTSAGKSNPYSDKLIKTLSKYNGKNIKIVNGDNSRICAKYNLPIDYIDLASIYSKIIYHSKHMNENITIFFNQDEIRKVPGVNPKNGIPIAMSESGKVLYYSAKNNSTISQFIAQTIDDQDFIDLYNKQGDLRRATYSMVKILNTFIPTIVILAHDLGLIKAMDLAGIKYDISSKKSNDINFDSIKLQDGFINYQNTYASMLLMNGLKDCNMESISITDLNKKTTWIAELDNFGGRNKSDGLDNFKELMYDPITVQVSKDYKLPTTYHEALIYASNLLVDNKYAKHIDISTNRYRTNEIVAAQFYRVLSTCYREYTSYAKRGRKMPLTMKQSAVIDMILQQNNTSDLSVFQPLLEIETKNTISTKGVSGLNEERSYTIDKRGYDKSMVNIIAQATGFASTVGVNRQTTIDPGIISGRGYFKQSDISEGSVTKSYCMTEALSPFVVTSDDPFRNDMTFVQTAKHSTPIENGTPLLVTTGADSAMPYLSSDMFAHKAKKAGKIIEKNDTYMMIEYKDGTKEFVNLAEQTMKNSDGGFYITLKLVTDKKVGDLVKEGEVVAWDHKSFSKKVGLQQLSYNMGCLTKIAVMSNEDGFEDSGVCSEWLSYAMNSDIVVMKPIYLPASTNVLSIAKVGQKIKEGEPVLVFQDAYDDADANALLKNLNVDDGDITIIGRNMVNSKVTGEISDIKFYRTCDFDKMSESLRSLVKNKEAQIQKIKNIASAADNDVQFDSVGKLPMTGKLKNAEDQVLIEIYMRYNDHLSVGDKLAALNANKVVLMNIYPNNDAPYTDFRPTEKIDAMTSASSMDGRIITSIMKNGALNKLLIELGRKCCDIYGVKWQDTHEIYETYKNQ